MENQHSRKDDQESEKNEPFDFKYVPLLELGEETMAQAMLIFLLADLRLLSSRGKIRTPFEHLSLDSDRSPRLSSLDFAGFHNYSSETTVVGVKANHIMAVLMLEILSEAEDAPQKKKGEDPGLLSSSQAEDPNLGGVKYFGKSARAANGLPNLLQCYNTMLNDDLKKAFVRMPRSEHPLNEDIQQEEEDEDTGDVPTCYDVQLPPHMSSATRKSEEDIPTPTSSSIQAPHFVPSYQSTRSLGKLQNENDGEEDDLSDSSGQKLKAFRDRMGTVVPKRIIDLNNPKLEIEELANVQHQMLLNLDNVENESSHASDDPDPAKQSPTKKPPKFHNSQTIRQLMREAVNERNYDRLAFIQDFFVPGTVSHTLAKSKSEMVWLSDWHEQYECTYAISMDKEKCKVLLAFRGAYTSADWSHILDYLDCGTTNPVIEDYEGRPNTIRVHRGFHKYLFRVRKDTGTTKYDEIAAKLAHYCELAAGSDGEGRPVRITITGHSLGSALATIFSLYASTEDRFVDNGRAIECVTFGCPCVGNWRFAGAVKHQEDTGRLRIAKFHVKGDVTPNLPPTLWRTSSRGAQYWHSGIDIMLPFVRNSFFQQVTGGQPAPKITYNDPSTQTYWSSIGRQLRDFYVWNMPVRFWRFALFHTLVEHRKRMSLVNKKSSGNEDDPDVKLMSQYSLKDLYEIRGELSTKKSRRAFIKNMKNKGSQSC